MPTAELLDTDGLRRWFLDAPEAEVMAAARERELLLELADCRRVILRATRRPDGSEWDLTRPDAEFRRAVRDLAGDGRRDDDAKDHDAAAAVADGSPGDPRIASIAHLARRYEEIRGMLAMANSRLVAYIARRYLNRGIASADLIQEGFCGLLEAIDRFDPINTTRLATYASWWIRQAFQRAIANGSYPVRLTPRQLRRLAQSLPRLSATVATEAQDPPADSPRFGPGRSARPPERAPHRQAPSWSELAAIRPRISLDAASRLDDATPLVELLAFLPEADQEDDELSESVGSLLTALSPREQFVLKLRFGLDGEPRHSLSQIGEILAVSKERVRQIQDRALRKLRDAAIELGLCEATAADQRPGGRASAGAGRARGRIKAARVGSKRRHLPGAGIRTPGPTLESLPRSRSWPTSAPRSPRTSPARSTSTSRASTATSAARPRPGTSAATTGTAAASSPSSRRAPRKRPRARPPSRNARSRRSAGMGEPGRMQKERP